MTQKNGSKKKDPFRVIEGRSRIEQVLNASEDNNHSPQLEKMKNLGRDKGMLPNCRRETLYSGKGLVRD
jgi:hypothetical protein